jgi:hypothetical protein
MAIRCILIVDGKEHACSMAGFTSVIEVPYLSALPAQVEESEEPGRVSFDKKELHFSGIRIYLEGKVEYIYRQSAKALAVKLEE